MSTFNDGWVAHANKLTSPPGCDGRWVPEGQTSPDDLYFNCFSTVTKNGPDGINHFALVYAAVFPDASWLSKLTGAGAPFSSGQYKYTFDWAMVAPRGETKFRPSPVWKSRQRLDLFVTGKDGALWTITYSGGWGAWHRRGGTLASGPACDSRQWKNPGRPVFCAARAPDGSVVYGKM